MVELRKVRPVKRLKSEYVTGSGKAQIAEKPASCRASCGEPRLRKKPSKMVQKQHTYSECRHRYGYVSVFVCHPLAVRRTAFEIYASAFRLKVSRQY